MLQLNNDLLNRVTRYTEANSNGPKLAAAWRACLIPMLADDLSSIIAEWNLDADATQDFIESAFCNGAAPVNGVTVADMSRFAKIIGYPINNRVMRDKLAAFFRRHRGLAGPIHQQPTEHNP